MSHSGKQSRSGSDATTNSVKSNERENPIILSINEIPSVELDIDKAEYDAIDKAIAKAYEPSVELHYTKESEKDDVNLLKEPTLLTMGDNVVEMNDGTFRDVRNMLPDEYRNEYEKRTNKGGKKKKSRKKSKKNKKKSKRKRTKGKK